MERIRRFFKRFGKGLKAKGYTLLEVAAVVAVTATLAAVVVPVVGDKIGEAKQAAAMADCQAIRDAIICFMKDTGVPPAYTTSSAVQPSEADPIISILVTDDGLMPNLTDANWIAFNSPTDSLDNQLILNSPSYRTEGTSAWKGPYLPNLKRDPWGNKYLVNVKYFGEPTASGEVKVEKAVYVISAGPNGRIETACTQVVKETGAASPTAGKLLGVKPTGDDILARIK